MNVPFYNFKKLHDSNFLEIVQEKMAEIYEENSFVEGKYNELFEKEFAKLMGAKFCRLVGNGTDALELALLAYGIGPGDLVGVPGITFHATAEAVLNVGAKVVHVDVDPSTGLMSPQSLLNILNSGQKLKAIMPVHIYGLPAPLDELQKVADKFDLKIVEDAAQAHGARCGDNPIGSSNNLITFSFYPTKNLGAFGDAGAILTQDEKLAESITSLRNHGRLAEGRKFFGRNSRCDHIQAAILYSKLPSFTEQQKMRKQVAQFYFERLENIAGIQLLPKKYLDLSSWHLFPILLENESIKLRLKEHLTADGISNALFYDIPLNNEVVLKDCPGEFEQAEKFSQKVLCLPMHPFLTDEELEFVASSLTKFFQ